MALLQIALLPCRSVSGIALLPCGLGTSSRSFLLLRLQALRSSDGPLIQVQRHRGPAYIRGLLFAVADAVGSDLLRSCLGASASASFIVAVEVYIPSLSLLEQHSIFVVESPENKHKAWPKVCGACWSCRSL